MRHAIRQLNGATRCQATHPPAIPTRRDTDLTHDSRIPLPQLAATAGPGTDLLSPTHKGSEIEFVVELNCW